MINKTLKSFLILMGRKKSPPKKKTWTLVVENYFNIYQEIYRPGTPNIRILCTVHSGRNVNNPSAPIAVKGKGLNSDKQSDVTVQQNKLVNILSWCGYKLFI